MYKYSDHIKRLGLVGKRREIYCANTLVEQIKLINVTHRVKCLVGAAAAGKAYITHIDNYSILYTHHATLFASQHQYQHPEKHRRRLQHDANGSQHTHTQHTSHTHI